MDPTPLSDLPMEEKIAARRGRWHKRHDQRRRRRTLRRMFVWTAALAALGGLAWLGARITNMASAGAPGHPIPVPIYRQPRQ